MIRGSIGFYFTCVKGSFEAYGSEFAVVGSEAIRFSGPVQLYRPNVALLLLNAQDELLICERLQREGAWQFPQGGMDEGESPLEALHREVEEEIGLPPPSYEVLESRDGYRYLFPPEIRQRNRSKKAKFDGQEQTYFLCRLKEGAPPINVDQIPREFSSHTWVKPTLFDLAWLPAFKRSVYREVLRDFFGVELQAREGSSAG